MQTTPDTGLQEGFIAIGSNLGSVHALDGRVKEAFRAVGVLVVKSSGWHCTEPIGPSQPRYMNAVYEVSACLPAMEVLLRIQQVEQAMGRQRLLHWGPRVIDLDLLAWGNEQISLPSLTVPHPEIEHRPFVVFPWEEIAPDYIVPGLNRTVRELAQQIRTSS